MKFDLNHLVREMPVRGNVFYMNGFSVFDQKKKEVDSQRFEIRIYLIWT